MGSGTAVTTVPAGTVVSYVPSLLLELLGVTLEPNTGTVANGLVSEKASVGSTGKIENCLVLPNLVKFPLNSIESTGKETASMK